VHLTGTRQANFTPCASPDTLPTNIENNIHETNVEIAERKAKEDAARFGAIKRMELKDKYRSGDANEHELPELYKQIEEYRNQRFQHHLDLLNRHSK
jgi:hypothetical protein